MMKQFIKEAKVGGKIKYLSTNPTRLPILIPTV
jgi:hypothetical protein